MTRPEHPEGGSRPPTRDLARNAGSDLGAPGREGSDRAGPPITGSRRRRSVAVAVLVVTVMAVGAGIMAGRSPGPSDTAAATASIDLPLLSDPGREWSLDAQRGTPQIVNFWASWCTPCRTEMPEIERIVRESNGQIAAVGINIWDQPDAAISLMGELGITYPLVTDPGGNTTAAFEVTALPTTLLVDGDGRVVAKATGRPTGEELQQMIADELGLAW